MRKNSTSPTGLVYPLEGLPSQTVASIADIAFRTPGSVGDRSSRRLAESLLARATKDARVPLADSVKAAGCGVLTIEQLIREHTLYPYLSLYGNRVASELLTRLVTGIGRARQPKLNVWAAQDRPPLG
jgi:hypothetical protein